VVTDLKGMDFALNVTERYVRKIYSPPPPDKLPLGLIPVCFEEFKDGDSDGAWIAVVRAIMPHGEELFVIDFDCKKNKASLEQCRQIEPPLEDIEGYLSNLGM
jgi:hypothetical protein